MQRTKENKKEETHSISIPREWVPEIEAIIEEMGGHSVNSFCRAAVRDMINLINAKRERRVVPQLVRQIDAVRTPKPFSSELPSDAAKALKKLDASEDRGAGQ